MGNRTRKLLTVGVIAAMTLSMAACTSGNDTSSSSGSSDKKETKAGTGKIGVAMPTKDLQRWNQDGENMKKQLEDAGYEVDLSLQVMMLLHRFHRLRTWYLEDVTQS